MDLNDSLKPVIDEIANKRKSLQFDLRTLDIFERKVRSLSKHYPADGNGNKVVKRKRFVQTASARAAIGRAVKLRWKERKAKLKKRSPGRPAKTTITV